MGACNGWSPNNVLLTSGRRVSCSSVASAPSPSPRWLSLLIILTVVIILAFVSAFLLLAFLLVALWQLLTRALCCDDGWVDMANERHPMLVHGHALRTSNEDILWFEIRMDNAANAV